MNECFDVVKALLLKTYEWAEYNKADIYIKSFKEEFKYFQEIVENIDEKVRYFKEIIFIAYKLNCKW